MIRFDVNAPPRQISLALVLIVGLLTSAAVHADPPGLDYLFPAGFARGTTTEKVTVGGATDPWPVKCWVDHDGIQVTAEKEKGRLTVVVGPDVPVGVYFLRLSSDQGVSSPRPFLVGGVKETSEVEPNNNGKQANLVEGPHAVNGRLGSSSDVDQFRVKVEAGQVLVASLLGNNVLASPMDAVLQICDENGFILAQNDDEQGLDPQLAFPVTSTGEYLVRLFAFPETPNGTIGFSSAATYVYRLTITSQQFVDHVMPLAVTRSAPTRLVAHGWNLPADGSLGMDVEPADDRQLLQPGNLFPGNLGLLTVVDCKSLVVDSDEPRPIQMPVVISGRVARPRSANTFLLQGKKGTPIVARIESRALGFPMDPLLQMLDMEGKVLGEVDDVSKNRDPLLSFTPPADGQYQLVVRDLHRDGGFRFVYRLSVSELQADFSLGLAADKLVMKSGEDLEVEVSIERIQGFKEEVELTIEGLPDGISCPAVVSAGEGDSAKKVKLKFSGSSPPFSGPLKIVGKAGERVRMASYAIPKMTIRRDDPWLSVIEAGK
jgi:hypothetical protein